MIHKYLLVFFLIGIVLVSSYDINRPSRSHSRPSSGQSHHNDHSHESHHPSGSYHHDHSHESHHPSGPHHHDHSHEEHHHDHSHESHHPSGSYHHDHSHEEHHHDHSHESHHPSGPHHEHSHESHHPSNPHHEQNSDSNSGDQTISIDDPIIEESDMEDFPIIENSEDEEEQQYAEDEEPIEDEDEQQYDEEPIEEDSSVEDEPISSGWSECEECIHFMRFLSRKFSRSINSRSDLLRFCNKNELMKPYCESNLGMIYNYLRTKLTNSHICSKLNICLVNKKNAIVNKIQDLATRLSSKIDKILSLDETASMELKLNNIMDLKNKNIMDLKHKNIMDLKNKNIMDLKHKNKNIMDLKNKNIMDLKQKNATQEIMELRQKNATQDIMELKHKNIMDLKHKNLMDLKPSRHENDIMELYPAKSHSQKSCKGQAPTRFHVCEDGEWVLHYSLSDARLLALSGTGICLVLALFTCLLCALRRRRPCKNASYQPVKTVETI